MASGWGGIRVAPRCYLGAPGFFPALHLGAIQVARWHLGGNREAARFLECVSSLSV